MAVKAETLADSRPIEEQIEQLIAPHKAKLEEIKNFRLPATFPEGIVSELKERAFARLLTSDWVASARDLYTKAASEIIKLLQSEDRYAEERAESIADNWWNQRPIPQDRLPPKGSMEDSNTKIALQKYAISGLEKIAASVREARTLVKGR